MASKAAAATKCALGQSVVDQILVKQPKPLNDQQKEDMKKKVEVSCMRFDKRGKGRLGVEDYYNVLKLQNKLECTKDELKKLCEDLDKDKEDKIAIKDFVHVPIISKAVFETIDKNKDGFVSKGELKLAAKGMSMKDLIEIINEIDKDNDGQLSFEEVKAINKKAYAKTHKKR